MPNKSDLSPLLDLVSDLFPWFLDMQDSYPYPYLYPWSQTQVNILTIIFTLQIEWVRRQLFPPLFLCVCVFCLFCFCFVLFLFCFVFCFCLFVCLFVVLHTISYILLYMGVKFFEIKIRKLNIYDGIFWFIKIKNRHSVLPFHLVQFSIPHIFFLFLFFPILIKHFVSPPPPIF